MSNNNSSLSEIMFYIISTMNRQDNLDPNFNTIRNRFYIMLLYKLKVFFFICSINCVMTTRACIKLGIVNYILEILLLR